MKEYPSIPDRINGELDIIAFNKLDGSNIRVEWSQKNGFYKFGTRHRLLDPKSKYFGGAYLLFKEHWEKILPSIFIKQKWIGKTMRVICFFEYHGSNSFAGWHPGDKDPKLTLIDVNIHKRGILPPKDFIKIFGHLNIPKVLYRGKANKTFIEAIRNSEIEDMSFEGVVCKAGNPSKKKTAKPIMFKIKSQAWFDRLHKYCEGDETKFARLK